MLTYSHIQVEASMCLWEAMLDSYVDGTLNPSLLDGFENWGTATMRHACIYAGPGADKLWNELTTAEQARLIPFDWEFCALLVGQSQFADEVLTLPTIEAIRSHLAKTTTTMLTCANPKG